MARLAMNELTTYRWSFEEDVHNYVAAGIHGIGVWRQKLSDYGEEKGIELLRESGLHVSGLYWAGGFTGSDGRGFEDSVDDALEAIALAAEMRADCLVVYTGGRGGHTHRHARRLLTNALEQLLPLAEQLDVTLALEPMHIGCAADWTFLTDLDDALEVVKQLNHSQLKIAFDTYHLAQENDIVQRLRSVTGGLGTVQLGDAKHPPRGEQDRCLLGDGKIQLSEIIAALEAAGYDGFYEVELMGIEIETSDYHELLSHTCATFTRLMHESNT